MIFTNSFILYNESNEWSAGALKAAMPATRTYSVRQAKDMEKEREKDQDTNHKIPCVSNNTIRSLTAVV